jgi:predicted NAD/FAD-binding protein
MNKIKEQGLKKIVIIGGSHSGFSCAWMLLNGPAAYYNNNAGLMVDKEPNAQRKAIKNCPDCCHCGV